MNRVAAKITQKVGVFLEYYDLDPRACQQEAEHHSGRASADDAAASLELRLDFSTHRFSKDKKDRCRFGLSGTTVFGNVAPTHPPYMSGGHLPPRLLALYTEILPLYADITEVVGHFP